MANVLVLSFSQCWSKAVRQVGWVSRVAQGRTLVVSAWFVGSVSCHSFLCHCAPPGVGWVLRLSRGFSFSCCCGLPVGVWTFWLVVLGSSHALWTSQWIVSTAAALAIDNKVALFLPLYYYHQYHDSRKNAILIPQITSITRGTLHVDHCSSFCLLRVGYSRYIRLTLTVCPSLLPILMAWTTRLICSWMTSVDLWTEWSGHIFFVLLPKPWGKNPIWLTFFRGGLKPRRGNSWKFNRFRFISFNKHEKPFWYQHHPRLRGFCFYSVIHVICSSLWVCCSTLIPVGGSFII